jgi:hypothetical protein
MESALTAPKLRWVLVYIIIVNSRGLFVSNKIRLQKKGCRLGCLSEVITLYLTDLRCH